MQNNKIKIIITILVVVLVAVGVWLYKKNSSITDSQPKITKDSAVPFLSVFPSGLIPETGILKVVDTFRVELESKNKIQYSYKYLTMTPIGQSLAHFQIFAKKNGYQQISLDTDGMKEFVSFSFRKEDTLVVVDINKLKDSEGFSVDITLVK